MNKNRILWACRRGMLELDLFLLPFFTRYFDALPLETQQKLVNLLEEADPDIFAWLMGHVPAPPEHQNIVELIRTKQTECQPTLA
jgi:antitoxin CptB